MKNVLMLERLRTRGMRSVVRCVRRGWGRKLNPRRRPSRNLHKRVSTVSPWLVGFDWMRKLLIPFSKVCRRQSFGDGTDVFWLCNIYVLSVQCNSCWLNRGIGRDQHFSALESVSCAWDYYWPITQEVLAWVPTLGEDRDTIRPISQVMSSLGIKK